jgi:acetylornithine/N-succinyldiaminopimelate aminotransferase
MDTISTEDKFFVPFFDKIQIAIDRGEGIYVWDEDGNKYLDFTSGWGVTALGHASPVIIDAMDKQSRKIIQNPSSGLTYSPPRAKLLALLSDRLPGKLQRLFFTNSGAEANDASIKLARKVTGRMDVISTDLSFHGRTISTASATGQAKHREKFNPLMPNYKFVPFNDFEAMESVMDSSVAAVILEPIQGEGGVNLPRGDYLKKVSDLCEQNGAFLIVDEVQTGFYRTGPMFAIDGLDLKVDFMTLAKGIAGGFPFGAFAMSEEVALKIEKGDHGGTYCGNPMGCAVAHAVIKHMVDTKIEENVDTIGALAMRRLQQWKQNYGDLILQVRGKGLLLAIQFHSLEIATTMNRECLNSGMFVNQTQESIIRLFPALNITAGEMEEGLALIENVLKSISQ